MESRCRRILEIMYPGKKFDSIRPTWLKSTRTNKNLELDCYNHDLKLALEYNGVQHYYFPNVWHKDTPDGFMKYKKTLAHDIFKRDVCRTLGITLIVVPYTVYKKNLPTYIYQKLVDAHKNKTLKELPARPKTKPKRTHEKIVHH